MCEVTLCVGFTIGIVNSTFGPLVFYIMCVTVFVVILAYFVSKGWIEVASITSYLRKLVCGRKKNKPKFAVENDEVPVPPKEEEPKRPMSMRSKKKVVTAAAAANYNESDWRVHEAVEEETRRLAESARRRNRAQVRHIERSLLSSVLICVYFAGGDQDECAQLHHEILNAQHSPSAQHLPKNVNGSI